MEDDRVGRLGRWLETISRVGQMPGDPGEMTFDGGGAFGKNCRIERAHEA
jgi:hypothetical protein